MRTPTRRPSERRRSAKRSSDVRRGCRVSPVAARGVALGRLTDGKDAGTRRDAGEPVGARLTGDQAGDEGAVAVAIGQSVGVLHEITARLHVGQPRTGMYAGVDDRHRLSVAAAEGPGARHVEQGVARTRCARIGAGQHAGGDALSALPHRRDRANAARRRRRMLVDVRRHDGTGGRYQCRRHHCGGGGESGCQDGDSAPDGHHHRLMTQANRPTR